MNSPYVRVAIVASAAVALLLSGGATAAAAPDSSGNKGGGKPSPAASGNASSNANGNSTAKTKGNGAANSAGNSSGTSSGTSSGNAAGNSSANAAANSQGKKPTNPGKPASNAGASNSAASNSSSGTKTLPDTASPVAQAAVNKDKPTTPVSLPSVPATEESAETVTPPADNTTGDIATAPAAQQNHNAPAPAGPVPARPMTNMMPGAPPQPGADGTESPGAPATAALTAPLSGGNAAPDASDSAAASVGRWLGDVATTVGREVREALREVTLKQLALAALPGFAGLLLFLATGVGLGHRQARFSFALETSGARLAPRGPLGLVSSGSFVQMGSRKPAAGRRTLSLVDRAA